jgi:D-xylose transport system substrate-binding protein
MKPSVLATVAICVAGVVIGWFARQGEAKPVAARTGPLIGLSLDTLKEERWQSDRDRFVARAQELGAEVLVQSANGDDTHQVADVQALLSRKVDVLVIVPHNGGAMSQAVQSARESGVPVISYDRLITGCPLDLYLTFDNEKVGQLQAQYLIDTLPKDRPIKLVRIYGAKTDNNALLFKKGQDHVLEPLIKSGHVQVVHEDWADDWKPENGKKIMNAALTRAGKNIDGVLASNDGTAGGAIQALIEEGLAGKIPVTGQDAELSACQRILAGTQAMTIYKPVAQLARRAAEVAVTLANKKSLFVPAVLNNGHEEVPSIFLDVIVATKANLFDTVVKDGFRRAEDLQNVTPAKP